MGVGGAGGAYLAKKMNITDLPQMVAGFHSLVGLAAVATSVSSYLAHGAADPVALTATFLGALIGTITMTGVSPIILSALAAMHGPPCVQLQLGKCIAIVGSGCSCG